MTQSTGGSPPYGQQENPSTPELAKDEATGVARTAAERGGQVGETAGEQAKRVASQTARQARNLVEEGRGQLVDQARQGQRKAAGSLHTLADQLHDMAEKSDGSGLAPELVRQASERARDAASWLEEREPGGLLDEVRALARRRPGMFLAGAALAGMLAGRLTRGAVDAARDDTGTARDWSGRGGQSGTTAPPLPQQYGTDPTYASMPPAPPIPPPAPPAPSYSTSTPGYATPPPPPQPGGIWPDTPGQRPGPVTR